MKKIFSCFTILVCFLVLGNVKNVYAAEIDTDDISNSTYVIGKCMFTRDVSNSYSGSLSTDVIMLAAKTIDSNNLEDMVIYYKNARGVWVNAITNETIEISEKVDIEYKNNEVYLEAPTLSIPAGGGNSLGTFGGVFTVTYEGVYVDSVAVLRIAGFELYEKTGESYTLIDTVLTETDKNLNIEYSVEVGESKTLVARVYALDSKGNKVYSEYSNEMLLTNMLETPTLSKGHGSSDTVVFVGFTIGLDGYYVTEESLDTITGWELYEKIGDQYNLVDGYEVNVDIGETKTYVARAYALNKNNQKVYSEYSNEITIDNSKPNTPTLSKGHGSSDTVVFVGFTIGLDGYYVTEESLDTITDWELYEKIGDQYNLVDGYEVNVDAGETKTYVARAYALNKKNEKIYSDYSNEVIIDNTVVS